MAAKVIFVTGASPGLGRMAANALAQSGHTVYAAIGRDAAEIRDVHAYAREQGVDLRALEIDLASEASVDRAVGAILKQHGRIDVLVHAAGPWALGPAEAFTPGQLAALYDAGVLAAQRINRAALPHMRRRGRGLLVWVSASSVAGGVPPYFSAALSAKAGLDALAAQYALELARWGIETTIVVPGGFVRRTLRGGDLVHPADAARAAEYEAGPYRSLAPQVEAGLAELLPADSDPGKVAGAIAGIVDMPFRERPFRIHVDPSEDGASVAFPVVDRVRGELLRRIGLADLLTPRVVGPLENGR